MRRLTSSLKFFLQIALLGIFLVFFGFPAIEKYQKKETITVSSEKFTNGIEAPALTIMGLDHSGLGWKTPQEGLDTWNTFKFDEHCAKLNTTSIEECVELDTFHLTDVIKSAQYGYSSSKNSSSFFWTQDLTEANMGKHFTLKSKKALLPNTPDDFLMISLHKNISFAVSVHDKNFFLVNFNPLGPPSNLIFFKQPFENFFLDSSCKMLITRFLNHVS